jgi:sugar phosphate isomerase/epimerase
VLEPIAQAGMPIIVHPDLIHDVCTWRVLGPSLLLENMDRRKHFGKTVADLDRLFERLPEAGLCVDVGHAKQVDPTLALLADLLTLYSARIRQFHVSQVDARSSHSGLSYQDIDVLCQVRSLLPEHAPVILECALSHEELLPEIEAVRNCLTAEPAYR